MKELVVYFSRKGYVRRIAESEAAARGAELMELKTSEPTAGVLGFWWCGRFGMHRWGMKLLPYSLDVAAYDNVVICSPVWVFSLCAPVREFIEREKGRIKAADCVLAHFSSPMRYPRALKWLDGALGIKHGRFTSVQCVWGKVVRTKTFPG